MGIVSLRGEAKGVVGGRQKCTSKTKRARHARTHKTPTDPPPPKGPHSSHGSVRRSHGVDSHIGAPAAATVARHAPMRSVRGHHTTSERPALLITGGWAMSQATMHSACKAPTDVWPLRVPLIMHVHTPCRCHGWRSRARAGLSAATEMPSGGPRHRPARCTCRWDRHGRRQEASGRRSKVVCRNPRLAAPGGRVSVDAL